MNERRAWSPDQPKPNDLARLHANSWAAPDCTCPATFGPIGRLYGVTMTGWHRASTADDCPHHVRLNEVSS